MLAGRFAAYRQGQPPPRVGGAQACLYCPPVYTAKEKGSRGIPLASGGPRTIRSWSAAGNKLPSVGGMGESLREGRAELHCEIPPFPLSDQVAG
jgi:hypothetical protein